MPRVARKKSKTGIYHIILRGINKQTIFEEEKDAEIFLQTIADYKEKSGYKIYAYCLMSNHIHLLIKEEQEELGTIMRRIGASYVYWYNWKYDRCGHLFQDRYKSEVVEDQTYLLTVLRYIHQNPIKAGIAKDISNYKWSSYSEYVTNKNRIVDTECILKLFNNDKKTAIDEFKKFHQKIKEDTCLDVSEMKRIKDDEAISIIKKVCNVEHAIDIQKLEKNERDACIQTMKSEGLSTRQIARLTGISRTIILKV